MGIIIDLVGDVPIDYMPVCWKGLCNGLWSSGVVLLILDAHTILVDISRKLTVAYSNNAHLMNLAVYCEVYKNVLYL